MRVLLLGGTGLIGTGITRALLAHGDEVTHLVRGTGAPAPGVRTVHGDRSSPAALAAAWGDGQDAVVDMLCFTRDDARTATAAFGPHRARYVMCSTVDVYTKPAPALPLTEDAARRPDPAFGYAAGKAAAEEELSAAHRRGDLALTVLRPACTYLDHAVPSIGSWPLALARLRRGHPLVLHGDGTGLWPVCHRDEVAAAFAAAVHRPDTAGRAYNTAGHELLTWNAYWQTVADALGSRTRFVHIPTGTLTAIDPGYAEWCHHNFRHTTVVDSSAAARDLGFRPAVGWRDGITAGLERLLAAGAPAPDPAEEERYEAVLTAWRRAGEALRTAPGPAAR